MAVCGKLQHIFETPLPESPSLPFHSFSSSWNKNTSMKSIDTSSFADLFGKLHIKENDNHVDESNFTSSSPLPLSSQSSTLSSFSSFSDANQLSGIETSPETESCKDDKKGVEESCYYPTPQKKQYKDSDSFSSMNSESLSICTEGLGFESSDDVENIMKEISLDYKQREEKSNRKSEKYSYINESKRSSRRKGMKSKFPPPISSIGSNGKPWVCFKSYRQDGRFILQEVRIPTQECMQACREDGRLKLRLIQSDDDDENDYKDEDDYSDDLKDVEAAEEGKGKE